MDFTAVDAALQQSIDDEELPCASYAVLRDGAVIAGNCLGWADREAKLPLREDHLFRAFSNTKLVTSLCALQLLEQGRFQLDDAIGDYLPSLRALRVLRPDAGSLADTEPAREPVRIRHLLTHTAGFTYAFVDPAAPIAKAYTAAGMGDPQLSLAGMVDALGTLPLLFQPGAQWNYGVSTDVVGRLVEVVAGEPLDQVFRRRVFEPLGLHDTFFFVPPEQAARLVTQYIGDVREPMRPGLRRADHIPFEGAYLRPIPRLNPGGGLVTSLGDTTQLLRVLQQGGAPLLQPESMQWVMDNQLPAGMWAGTPAIEGRGHSFAASVTVQASEADPASVVGDVQWGGLAGTKWLLSPRDGFAVALMTQRYAGHALPYWPRFVQGMRRALSSRA